VSSRSHRVCTRHRRSNGTTCTSSAVTTSGRRTASRRRRTSFFAVEFDRRGAPAGIRAFSVYPGAIKTPLQRHLDAEETADRFDEQGNPLIHWKTPEQGAATSAWGATSPQLDGMGGVYLENCDVAEVADPDTEEGQRRGVNQWAIDPQEARRVWKVSADLTGVDAFT
jgi:hypothetical protein